MHGVTIKITEYFCVDKFVNILLYPKLKQKGVTTHTIKTTKINNNNSTEYVLNLIQDAAYTCTR